ncbi:MAG: GNAT family N-acetyltransferase [Rhodoplanes sp.]|uniref:GNAT family N-acetyltransferase n=1 Tax=Rhodoplanes sp. TaxID=1968906 RepID=UPI001854300B|nr:GNAT family N-acetyltransferase [Rhodoplanes sp.]NVO12876.1 GNAT family N-acetyltransferase [Rhodoplanes sp.]
MQVVFVEGGLIRKLWPMEAHAYRDHLLRLDADSRRSRFGGAVSDEMVRAYAETLNATDTIIHGFFVDGILRGAADLRLMPPVTSREAEAAFSVEKRWQSHGVGSALLERCLLAARNRSINLMHVACLSENHRMQQLARKFATEFSFDFGTVVGKVQNPRPTPLSLIQELLADGHSFAAACIDLQSRLLKPSGPSSSSSSAT